MYADFHDIEYSAIREAAAVIDIEPALQVPRRGPDAGRLLDRVDHARHLEAPGRPASSTRRGATRTARSSTTAPSRGCATDEYRVTSADPCYRWFLLNATALDVDIGGRHRADLGALALQGKLSSEVLEAATGEDWTDVRYFRHRRTSIAGVDVSVTRTGYTGDRGYELWIPVAGALAVWDRVVRRGRGVRDLPRRDPARSMSPGWRPD
mgnify:CR=1 FL=1